MIFRDDNHIAVTIAENPSKDILKAAREMSAMLTMYVTGEGLKEKIEQLPYFEKDELAKIRRKLTRTTRDLFDRLLQPLEKVFTAKGGVVNYNLSTEQEGKFAKLMSNVRKGMSMEEWVQYVALMAFLIDPNSLLYTEIDWQGNAYPTYKSTLDIFDYQLDGQKPEYVIFNTTADEEKALVEAGKMRKLERGEKLYRVVDDAFDRYIIYKNKKIEVAYQVVNYFKYVPGQLASNISVFGTSLFESPLAPVMELAADFFNDNSTKSLFKKYQMHPREWSIEITCHKCEGHKVSGSEPCDNCNGTGLEPTIKVAQRIAIALGEDGSAKAPIPPGGFYTPPIESWNMSNQELDRLVIDITDTFWGSSKIRRTTGMESNQEGNIDTATGEVFNERSKESKLKKFSKWGQDRQKFQTDNCKKVIYRNLNINESTITYGDRYLLESPDELEKKYREMKMNKLSYPLLDKALDEVLEAKYAANAMELRRQRILAKLEPYVHHTIDEVMAWQYLPDDVRKRKLYFAKWLAETPEMFFYMTSDDAIKREFERYVDAQEDLVQPEPEKPKVAA